MSSLFKTTTKGKGKARASQLPAADIAGAVEDAQPQSDAEVSAGQDSDGEDVDMEDTTTTRPAKKVKVVTDKTGDASKEDGPKRRKDKVLMLSSRGTTQRMRHLMLDLEALLPHVKKDAKLDSKSALHLLNELADLHSCNNTLYFEARRHEDLYLWISRSPNGPSAKCHVQNVHTMDELKMTGNCLKGSRGIVCFDGGWGDDEWSSLMKEMLTHAFSVPKTSRKLKPFIDHILTFSLLDNKIWFRNYQIIEKDPLQPAGPPQTSLVEIGPRFVLTPIRIFEGSFGGPTVFENPEFISPAATRASVKRAQGSKYRSRKDNQAEREDRRIRQKEEVGEDELAVGKVFA